MDTGSTAWILVSTALVALMTPGLAFFYGGLVRQRQVINTIKMSVIAMGLIAVQWAVIGYSLAFSEGSALVGGFEFVGLSGVGTTPDPRFTSEVPHLAFMAFQMMFAIITPALISGAVVGRMKFKAYSAFILLWGLLVYAPLAHWVWGPGGWIGEMGALDFAGGTVVHISAGVSALVCALILGPRHPVRSADAAKTYAHNAPHNVPFVVLGTALLWFGWFGFNAGSALAADGIAALALVTTMLGGSAGLVTWVALEVRRQGKPTATGASIGAVVGLVTITPAAGFVSPMSALLIGGLGAAASFGVLRIVERTSLDDTLDVFACHGVGGLVGCLLTGVFASTAINAGGADGLLYGDASLLWAQAVSAVAAAAYAAAATAGLLVLLRATVGLRAPSEVSRLGIDVAEHAESAYVLEGLVFRGSTNKAEPVTMH